MRQDFKTKDALRLEVGARPATGLTNLIKNPNGEGGSWGWITPLAGGGGVEAGGMAGATAATYLIGWDSPYDPLSTLDYLEFSSGNSVAPAVTMFFTSEPEPVTVGRFVSAQIRLREPIATGQGVGVRVQFLNAAGVAILESATTEAFGGTAALTVLTTAPIAAPANTTHAHIRIEAYGATAGTRRLRIDRAMLTSGTTAAAVTGYAYVAPYTFTDILSPTHQIDVDRAGLTLGTLTAHLRSAAYDPALNPLLRPGNPVRLLARVSDNAGQWNGNTYTPVFEGKIKHAGVQYDLLHPDPAKRTVISLTAVDPAAPLSNLMQPVSVKKIGDLRYLLEGCGVPFSVLDDAAYGGLKRSGQVPGVPTVVALNDKASVLDQIALTRDTLRAHSWVTRGGVLTAVTTALADTTVRAALDDADYNGNLNVDYDTSRLINVVTVKRLAFAGDQIAETTETLFGPYVDETSFAQWGAYAEEFTVAGLSDAEVATFAAAVLAANATPQVAVNSLTIPIRTLYDFRPTGPAVFDRRVQLDLYDRVTVTNARAAITAQPLRIAGIRHRITSDKWLMHLDFAAVGGVAMPSPSPPVVSNSAMLPDGLYHRDTLATTMAGTIGDIFWSTTIARVTTGKRIRLTASGAFTPPSVGTGILIQFQRSVNGAAYTLVGPAFYAVAPQASQTGFTFTHTDAPPAGSTVYRVRVAAHLANGQSLIAGSQFTAEAIA